MRAIEQLIHHFWARGALTREEALFLVGHGFAREADLPGLNENTPTPPEEAEALEPPSIRTAEPDADELRARAEADTAARRAEELEDELVGRNAGSKKGGGKKKKPTGHNLGPAVASLAAHLAAREPYPALCELGCRIRHCTDWRDAARAVGSARTEVLEPALVGLLTTRPRALGELWFWFDLEPLFEWAADKENSGPVADGLSKLLRTDNFATVGQVGRLGQLLKATEVQALFTLLPARRAFMNLLPVLYHAHFPKLGQWLVPPAGVAANGWPALPWSFVFVYNARHGATGHPPLGYPLDRKALSPRLEDLALTTAVAMAPVAVREWLIHGQRENDQPTAELRVYCPFTWRV
jgi:hypothetical protein